MEGLLDEQRDQALETDDDEGVGEDAAHGGQDSAIAQEDVVRWFGVAFLLQSHAQQGGFFIGVRLLAACGAFAEG